MSQPFDRPNRRRTLGLPASPGGASLEPATGFSQFGEAQSPPVSPRPRTFAARWLIGFVVVSMLATNAWLVFTTRQHEVEQTYQVNANLARAISERVEVSIAQLEQILDALVQEMERQDLSDEMLLRLQPTLVNHVARTEQLHGLFVFDASGNWIATSEPSWDAGRNNADRPYFIHHRDNPSASALLGAPTVSRSTGDWVVPISRRLTDADGNFSGVVLATMSLEHLRRVLARFDVGEGAVTLTIAGHHAARHPLIATDVGKPADAVDRVLGSATFGSGQAHSPIDGVNRFYSFERGRSFPVLAIASSSHDEVLSAWRLSSWLQTLWVLLLCAALLGGVRVIRRALQHRVRAEEELREAHSALATANERLRKLAQLDALTGLPNRGYFDRRLDRAWRQAKREQTSVAVIMIDVDCFKQFNDTYGHVKGDSCLVRVAAALRTVIRRPEDFVARYGGEEMVVLLRATSLQGAIGVAEAARKAVKELAIAHASSTMGVVTISLGVAALVPGPTSTSTELLTAADGALYCAKQRGRNQVQSAA